MIASNRPPFRRTLPDGFDHHEMARGALEAPELGLRRHFRHDLTAIWAALWGVHEGDKNETGTRSQWGEVWRGFVCRDTKYRRSHIAAPATAAGTVVRSGTRTNRDFVSRVKKW